MAPRSRQDRRDEAAVSRRFSSSPTNPLGSSTPRSSSENWTRSAASRRRRAGRRALPPARRAFRVGEVVRPGRGERRIDLAKHLKCRAPGAETGRDPGEPRVGSSAITHSGAVSRLRGRHRPPRRGERTSRTADLMPCSPRGSASPNRRASAPTVRRESPSPSGDPYTSPPWRNISPGAVRRDTGRARHLVHEAAGHERDDRQVLPEGETRSRSAGMFGKLSPKRAIVPATCDHCRCRPHGGEAFTSTPGRHVIVRLLNAAPGFDAVHRYRPGVASK